MELGCSAYSACADSYQIIHAHSFRCQARSAPHAKCLLQGWLLPAHGKSRYWFAVTGGAGYSPHTVH